MIMFNVTSQTPLTTVREPSTRTTAHASPVDVKAARLEAERELGREHFNAVVAEQRECRCGAAFVVLRGAPALATCEACAQPKRRAQRRLV